MSTHARSDLTRLDVALIPRAEAALDIAAQLTGDSRTDTVNRALQVYGYLTACRAKGEQVYLLRRTRRWWGYKNTRLAWDDLR